MATATAKSNGHKRNINEVRKLAGEVKDIIRSANAA